MEATVSRRSESRATARMIERERALGDRSGRAHRRRRRMVMGMSKKRRQHSGAVPITQGEVAAAMLEGRGEAEAKHLNRREAILDSIP